MVVQAIGPNNVILAEQATTLVGANVGAGGPGTFSVSLTVSMPTAGFVKASSPQSPVAPVSVPVTFAGTSGGTVTYITYASGQCMVNVAAGQPFYTR